MARARTERLKNRPKPPPRWRYTRDGWRSKSGVHEFAGIPELKVLRVHDQAYVFVVDTGDELFMSDPPSSKERAKRRAMHALPFIRSAG